MPRQMRAFIVLSASLCATGDAIGAAAFLDVFIRPRNESIMQLAELGIVEGYPDGTFRPSASCKRRHAALALGRLIDKLGVELQADSNALPEFLLKGLCTQERPAPDKQGLPGTTANEGKKSPRGRSFTDVPFHRWGDEAIPRLVEMGIVTGHNDGRFCGEAPITREEFLVMVARVIAQLPYKIELDLRDDRVFFSDVNDRRYSLGPIILVSSSGIFEGSPGKRLRPRQSLTRYELALALARLMHVITESQERDSADTPNCPGCGPREGVVPILYGLRDSRDMIDMLNRWERKEIELGGCRVHHLSPAWHCNRCGKEWGLLCDSPDDANRRIWLSLHRGRHE